jgi:hypothetical protein
VGNLNEADYREPSPAQAQRQPLLNPLSPPLTGGTTTT